MGPWLLFGWKLWPLIFRGRSVHLYTKHVFVSRTVVRLWRILIVYMNLRINFVRWLPHSFSALAIVTTWLRCCMVGKWSHMSVVLIHILVRWYFYLGCRFTTGDLLLKTAQLCPLSLILFDFLHQCSVHFYCLICILKKVGLRVYTGVCFKQQILALRRVFIY